MSTQELALPTTGDSAEWTASEKALVEAAGLVSHGKLAPRATVEAFLQHCVRTGLDPIARQIYAIERGGKWGIQVSIDGARLVAERSGEYRGQTPVQWTTDGITWVDVWLADVPPKAARVGVHRSNFDEPLVAVATLDQYNAGGPMWKKMPALMLGKCAEMLALRKAFPQDLSGLYSTEEMDQAGNPRKAAAETEVAVLVLNDSDWDFIKKATLDCADKVALRQVFNDLKAQGLLEHLLPGTTEAVRDFLMKAAAGLPDEVTETVGVKATDEPLPPAAEAEISAEVIADEVTGEVVELVTEWATAEIPAGETAEAVASE